MNQETDRFYEQVKSRILLDRLLLKRSPLDYQAYVETFRESLIDANPHQVEAIVFALEKLENGGCILADEVGLGKTIEAGLVISQFRAQRRFNVLIIVPTSLAGQWSSELRRLFQISSRIITGKDKKALGKKDLSELFKRDGVYVLGREFASRLEKEKALRKKGWDLIVVDEAHEIFANIYRRFDTRTGDYKMVSKESAMAANMFDLFKRSPVLLLTATPIQNNILELWGLSSYILPGRKKSHLGQFNHFKELFLDGREVVLEKVPELKKRINNFLVRNLRVNAQNFMKYKFTSRNCETLNFNMGEAEKALYNDISDYFERNDIYAYSTGGMIDLKDNRQAGIRNLLKMSYRRVLGSSFSALTKSLYGIVARLEKMKAGEWEWGATAAASGDPGNDEDDFEAFGVDVDEEEGRVTFNPSENEIQGIEREIGEVKSFIAQAEKIGATGKDKLLVKWLNRIFQTPDRFSGKAVIFTTYTATQQHLMNVLEENGFKDDVLIFSGGRAQSANEKEDRKKALELWEEEIGPTVSPSERPAGNILERTALVHYFKNRKKIFISTEAGAKGLNLQFCNVIINYDLPWNPQRIEQRIGRCHRYGQVRDVLVINCINADNETEQHIYNILDSKFSLFKTLMGAGDDVLGTLSKAVNFETRVHEILNEFKTPEERKIWLKRLEEEIDEQTRKLRDRKLKKTRTLLDELDPHVKAKMMNIKEKLPESFSRYDTDMLNLLRCIAVSRDIPFEEVKKEDEQVFFRFDNTPYYIGQRDEDNIRDFQHIDLKHPLMEDWISRVRQDTFPAGISLSVDYSGDRKTSRILEPYTGCSGRWDFYRVRYNGFEEEERLYHIVCIDCNGELKLLQEDEVAALQEIRLSLMPGVGAGETVDEKEMQLRLDSKVKAETQFMQQRQQPRIDKKIHNMNVELMDMEEYMQKDEQAIRADIAEIDKKINTTFDVKAGKKLLEQKRKRQNDLKECRKNLLEFQNNFQENFDDAVLDMMEKRFIDYKQEKIFGFHIRIT